MVKLPFRQVIGMLVALAGVGMGWRYVRCPTPAAGRRSHGGLRGSPTGRSCPLAGSRPLVQGGTTANGGSRRMGSARRSGSEVPIALRGVGLA